MVRTKNYDVYIVSTIKKAKTYQFHIFLSVSVSLRNCVMYEQSEGTFQSGDSQLVCFAFGILPPSHVLQNSRFLSSWYFPETHKSHVRASFPERPRSQDAQLADPSLSVVSPASHFLHRVISTSAADLAQPMGHNLHPTPNDPAPQSVHAAEPSRAVNLPASHFLQTDCLASPVYSLIAHWMHSLFPVSDWNLPGMLRGKRQKNKRRRFKKEK